MESNSSSLPSLAETKPRVLCYGDSLTAGFITVSPYTQKYAPWAPVLEETLGVQCDAIGASGWTTKQMVDMSATGGKDACLVKRPGLQRALQEKKYTVVIIMGGTNDLGQSEADDIVANLRTLHEQCHAAGCKTVAVTIPQGRHFGPWTAGTPFSFANERRVKVNSALELFAKENTKGQCLFVAMDEEVKWSKNSVDFEPDGLHMSAEGYAKFGALLAPKVRDFIDGKLDTQ
eukprot:CAMPEP_0185741632 /NCGR_PEP_ID=MMETSP1171-20130828/39062_1 /TAXON_ID=374046 /ORGANISM="Helicotheca tamensis, Strain CCMP826" /LENGTH=231 /DNA_ID=CAMNT_0028413613 /DNA_START=154 /DNA_END=849 /DNA_ORIENTATION=+